MTVTTEKFRCMACGFEYQELVEKGEDKERTCSRCRSNSIRHLKPKRGPAAKKGGGNGRGTGG